MLELPKDLASYSNSYILIRSKEQLYYVLPGGTIEKIAIQNYVLPDGMIATSASQNFSLFNKEVIKLFGEKKVGNLPLTAQQITELITSHEGYGPYYDGWYSGAS